MNLFHIRIINHKVAPSNNVSCETKVYVQKQVNLTFILIDKRLTFIMRQVNNCSTCIGVVDASFEML